MKKFSFSDVEWSDFKFIFTRILYDAFFSVLALGLAFTTRAFLLFITKTDPIRLNEIVQDYISHFFKYSVVIVVLTFVCNALFGFYKANQPYKNLKPWLVIGSVSLVPILFSTFIYFSSPFPQFSRGVLLLLWGLMLVLIAMPRLVKYFSLKQAVLALRPLSRRKPRNVLVIGGAGYIGSQLVRDMVNDNYKVRVLDSLMFGDDSIRDLIDEKKVELVVGDFRNVESVISSMKDMDAVVHLGGIVGDPACSLDDDFTIDVNLTATTMIAEACKLLKIERLIFASTCSVYGQSSGTTILTEESPKNPVSLYAQTKIGSENVLLKLASDDFHPCILRFSTLFGLSPRPRFDLVVNILSAKASTDGDIHVFGGNQWRPFVHVKDTSKAIRAALKAPIQDVSGQIFNVGSKENNYQIIEVGKKVEELIPGTKLNIDGDKEDARNYNVSFDKIEKVLNIKLDKDLEYGIKEIHDAFKSGKITSYSSNLYSNVRQTEKLLQDFVNSHVEGADIAEIVIHHHKKNPKSILKQL